MLDTHVLIWVAGAESRLAAPTLGLILDLDNEVVVSVATAWEIAIKCAQGKLIFPIQRFGPIIASFGMVPLPIKPDHAIAAGALPRHHADPFDRMLVAQARIEGLTLVTTDPQLARYGVAILAA